jgi:hypothetical protein
VLVNYLPLIARTRFLLLVVAQRRPKALALIEDANNTPTSKAEVTETIVEEEISG